MDIGNATMDLDMMNINATTAQRLGDMKKAKTRTADPAKAEAVAQEFEAQFIASMLDTMFSTIPTDGPLGGGQEEETYRSLLTNEYGKIIARSGGIGVADHVKREMLRLQEVEPQALPVEG